MSDFDDHQAQQEAAIQAQQLVKGIKSIYTVAGELDAIWTEYEADTNAALTTMVEGMYTSGARTILDTAIGHLVTARTALETHAQEILDA